MIMTMTLRDKINDFANDKYYTLKVISKNVTDKDAIKVYLYTTDDFIDAFYNYIDENILRKLTNIYCEIVSAWGLDHNCFRLTAYED